MFVGSACSMASAKNSSSDGMNSLKEENKTCHSYWRVNADVEENFHLVLQTTDLLSDLQASMLSWFKFHSRVNSSLTKHRRASVNEVNMRLKIQTNTFLPPALLSSVFNNILSHEDLAVGSFSKEVFWCLSFPGGSFGFVIYYPVQQEMTTKVQLYIFMSTSKLKRH